MKIFKATPTLDNYLPPLEYTTNKAEARMILVGGKKFDLGEFPMLEGVFKTGVGTDNLPFEEAKARGVEIRLPSQETCDTIYEETSAFACHLILSCLYAGAGDWDQWKKADRPMTSKRRLLVIGTGRIGGRVAEKMRGLMTVATFDSQSDPGEALESLVRAADCVSLHIPLSAETTNFFDSEKLSWMKDGASLVNTARGPIVNEAALFAELSSGRLRAALDVFWQEPYEGKLAGLPGDRLIRSPHIASTCREFLEGCATDFLAFLKNVEHGRI